MSNGIDPTQPLPIFSQLKAILLAQILAGEYEDGRRLPTEHELSEHHSISRTPVHRALAELAAEGVILRQRHNGSFVNPHWLARNRDARELRLMVPEGPWADLARDACPAGATLNVATVALDDLHLALVRAVAEGRAPDVALFDSVWVSEFGQAGFLLPLDELDRVWVEDSYVADAVEPFRDANRVGGQVVAVQAEADVVGLWCRRDALTAVGMQAPRTWDQLAEVAQALVETGWTHPVVMRTGTRAGETTTYTVLAMLAGAGVSLIEEERVTVDQPATHACLRLLADLVERGLLSQATVRHDFERGPRLLAEGEAAMLIGGSYELGALADVGCTDAAGVWDRFGFTALPRPSGPGRGDGRPATLAGGMVYGVFRQAASPHLALSLLRRLMDPATLSDMSRRTGQLPPTRSATARVAAESPFLSATARLMTNATVRPATATYARVSTQVQQMVQDVVLGQRTPEQAARQAADRISAITGLPALGR